MVKIEVNKYLTQTLMAITAGCAGYSIMSYINEGTITEKILSVLAIGVGFGFATYKAMQTRCPSCGNAFALTEDVSKRIIGKPVKEPFTYFSRIIIEKDGTEQVDPTSKTTIMRDKIHTTHLLYCKYCGNGKDGSIIRTTSKRSGKAPEKKKVIQK